ncbi:hypothetical protein RI129_004969 [Pyrocoelia pectoralis]|uniref:CRAL-TRIO domain-containing protein n=1 Tax=Pyrocoelia pectoralis TaxID=417401 RepID=A0AAN7ZH62_9COLE
MYANRDPSSGTLKEFLDKGIFLPLEMEGKDRQSFLCRLGVPDAEHITLNDITKFGFMISDIVLYENDYAIIKGQNIIYDLKGIPRARIFEITLSHIKNFVSARHGLPARIKCITILNVPPIMVPVLEKIRMLLGQKLGNMMRLCPEGNLEELYKHVPISLIPKQYGGEACINEIVDHWKQKMEEYKDWFLEDAIFCTDETKRIEDKFSDDYFGVDGSFRKLELD